MYRRRDDFRHDKRVVDLAAHGGAHGRRKVSARSRRSGVPGLAAWSKVALIAVFALVAIAGREGAHDLIDAGWQASVGARSPIRAAINVDAAPSASCSFARVIDGDTLDVSCPGHGLVRARLLGFDTPEVFSPGCASELALGRRATAALARRIREAGQVRMVFAGLDKYDRRLMRLYLDGRDVAEAMVADGLARPYGGGRRTDWCT